MITEVLLASHIIIQAQGNIPNLTLHHLPTMLGASDDNITAIWTANAFCDNISMANDATLVLEETHGEHMHSEI